MLLGKNYDNAFYSSKVTRQNIVVSFLGAVGLRDNVILVCHDYVIIRISVIILGIHCLSP